MSKRQWALAIFFLLLPFVIIWGGGYLMQGFIMPDWAEFPSILTFIILVAESLTLATISIAIILDEAGIL